MAPLDGAAETPTYNAYNASNTSTLCLTEDGRARLDYCDMLQCEVERAPNTEYIGVGLQVLSVSISASCLLIMKLSTDYEKGLPLFPCRRGSCHRGGWKWRFVAGWAVRTQASHSATGAVAAHKASRTIKGPSRHAHWLSAQGSVEAVPERPRVAAFPRHNRAP